MEKDAQSKLIVVFPKGRYKKSEGAMYLLQLWNDGVEFETIDNTIITKSSNIGVVILSLSGDTRVVPK